MRFVYYGAAVLLYVAALPFLVFLCFKSKYTFSIPARFFLKNNAPFEPNARMWFHACSLGEVRSLKPLVETFAPSDVRISVMTQTGFREAALLHTAVRYLPFEIFLPFWTRSQDVLVVMEAELWPLLFISAKAKGIRTVLLNARISDHSYASYTKFAWFYRWIFRYVDTVLAQSEEDKERLAFLGAKRISVVGNIKQYQRYGVTKVYDKPKNKRLIVIASTHEKEEALILEHIAIKENDTIVVVPRHPERFEKIRRWLASYATEHRRSFDSLSHSESLDSDLILCDQMGRLIDLYAVADVVILGGSFVEGVGGHNPLEPAFFGVKLISGASIFNQKVLFEAVENAKIVAIDALYDVFEHIDEVRPSFITPKDAIEPLLEKIRGTDHDR